jgi:cold shock CspA family protein
MMMGFFDFSSHIGSLKTEKKYKEALSFFKENKAHYTNEQIGKNEYLISDMVTCLRHSNYFDAAFQFLNIYQVKIEEETSERILTAYGWLLYSKFKAENNSGFVNYDASENEYFDDEEHLGDHHINAQKSPILTQIEELIPLLKKYNSKFAYSVLSRLFSIVLKTEKKKPAPNWNMVSEFCDIFDPDQLSTDCDTIQVERKGRMKDMELASDRENWYAYKTKALFKLGAFQECYEVSKKALESFDSFHYSNDVWFARRIALSKKHLGNKEDTIFELKKILRQKKEWFIQKELSEMLYEDGKNYEAFEYAIQAVNNFGPLEFKVDLFFLLGKILLNMDEKEKAFQHFSLSKLLRLQEEWRVPQKVIDELQKFNLEEIKIENLGKLKCELKDYWDTFKESAPNKKNQNSRGETGVVKTILHNNEKGKNGFISTDNGDIYFTLPAHLELTKDLVLGSKVSFTLKMHRDKEQARITSINK